MLTQWKCSTRKTLFVSCRSMFSKHSESTMKPKQNKLFWYPLIVQSTVCQKQPASWGGRSNAPLGIIGPGVLLETLRLAAQNHFNLLHRTNVWGEDGPHPDVRRNFLSFGSSSQAREWCRDPRADSATIYAYHSPRLSGSRGEPHWKPLVGALKTVVFLYF